MSNRSSLFSWIKNRSIVFKFSFFILSSCTIIFLFIFGYNYLFAYKIITQGIRENAKNLTQLTVAKIETVLLPMQKVPENIAYSLEYYSYDKEGLFGLLRSVIENNSEIYGSTIAFEPYAFEKEALYFAPYYYKSKGEIKFRYLGGENYKYFEWDWYRIPKESKRAVWTEPYYDEGGGDIIMSTYSAPFYKNVEGKKQFMGVITADVSLTWLEDIISDIKIGQTGYGFLISKKGMLVTYPDKSFIMHKTIFDLLGSNSAIGESMIKGKSGFMPTQCFLGSKKCWLAYMPLPSNGWSLGIVFPQDELMAGITQLNHIVFTIGAIGFLFLMVVIALLTRSITKPLRTLVQTTQDIASGNLEFVLPEAKSRDEVGRLTDSFIYMRGALKKYIKELTETVASKERMESELNIAHDIQMSIVPRVFPAFSDRTEFDIYAVLSPAKKVGGDYYDFFMIDDDRLCFVIADVSDKGVPAALFMAMTKSLIKATAGVISEPGKILAGANKQICQENDLGMFITVFCGVLNIKTGELTFVNAGHNPPLIIRGNKEVEFLVGAKSGAIGISEDKPFKQEKITLRPQDVLYMYTDGVTEAFNEKQEQFSEERLKNEVTNLAQDSVEEIVEATLDEVKSFAAGAPQSDDITVMALKFFADTRKSSSHIKDGATVILRNEISEIPRLKEACVIFGKKNHLGKQIIEEACLVLEEAVSNIIYYGYEDVKRHRIIVRIYLEEKDLILEISDDAKPFNPLQFKAPDIDKSFSEREIGGLGVHLIGRLADHAKYKRERNKNILTIRKKAKE
ncbi:MAG: SpoIIE family protein phosphatase [Candidatus Omnitrophota bacterium]